MTRHQVQKLRPFQRLKLTDIAQKAIAWPIKIVNGSVREKPQDTLS